MTKTLESRSRRVRRKLRGTGPFVLVMTIVAMVLGRAPASADHDDEAAEATAPVVEASPPVVEEAPVVEAPAVADPAAVAAELHLGTRLTALGVMRLRPNPAIVAAAAG